MALIPCEHQIGCESDYPVTNYSSEDPDPRSFIGFSTGTAPTSSFPRNTGGGGPKGQGPDGDDTGDGPAGTAQTGTGGDPPPLGSDYDNPIVTTFAESTESQEKAWDDAGNENVAAITVGSNTGEPGGGIVLNPSRQRPAVYGNDAQQCSVICPDGQTFTYTVAANTFKQLSKAKADAAALSFACKQAALNQICLGPLTPTATVGVLYDSSIVANTANIPVTFIIISGDIPTWATAHVGDDSVQIIGTPSGSDIGATSFTIQATDVFGNTMTRAYTITVSAGASCDPVASPAVQVFTVNAASSVFCDKTGTIFAIESTTGQTVVEINTSGVVINSFLIGFNISCIFYENTNQRLYIGYNAAGNKRVASYDPSTRLLINFTTLTGTGPTVNTPAGMTYDPTRNNLWVTDAGSYVWKLNANTLVQTVVAKGSEFNPENGIVYCANQDKIIILGTFTHVFPIGPTLAISVWNPSSMAFTYIDAGGTSPFDIEEICYNSNNGLAYGCASPDISGADIGQVWVIDPNDIASFVAIDLPLSKFAVTACYNPCTDKVIAVATIAGNILKAYYINTSDNTISGTASPGVAWLTSQNPLTYDAADARVWMGTGLTLLKFT